jgi:hypothetical protein
LALLAALRAYELGGHHSKGSFPRPAAIYPFENGPLEFNPYRAPFYIFAERSRHLGLARIDMDGEYVAVLIVLFHAHPDGGMGRPRRRPDVQQILFGDACFRGLYSVVLIE